MISRDDVMQTIERGPGPGLVAFGRGQELVLEAEAVEEGAQPCVLVRAEARCVPNGSGTEVSGFSSAACSSSWFGTLVGTLRRPSMSSEKQTSRVLASGRSVCSACRTIEVRATSPNVPICGSPDGP